MSDWPLLETCRVTVPTEGIAPCYITTAEAGFNGLFRVRIESKFVRCIASDGRGAPDPNDPAWQWQHVSVSVEWDKRPPPWGIMCKVKELFWEPEDWVVQFHPARSQYVNFHPGCLHLWRPLAQVLPTPLAIMVGPKPKLKLKV